MEWTKDNFRELRLRLGLCQSDMARHLHLELSTLFAIEEGELEVNHEIGNLLEILTRQADDYCETIMKSSRLDSIFQDHPLEQVDFVDLLTNKL